MFTAIYFFTVTIVYFILLYTQTGTEQMNSTDSILLCLILNFISYSLTKFFIKIK
jgi:hypothetical protein